MNNRRALVVLLALIGLFLLTKIGFRTESKQSKPLVPAAAIFTKTAALFGFSTEKQAGETFTQEWFNQESTALNDEKADQAASDLRLKAAAAKFTDTDRQVLTATVKDALASQNDRMLAMYLLSLDPKASNEIFVNIAAMSDPIYQVEENEHLTADQFQLILVQSLAISALDVLQNRALQQPALIGRLQEISQQSPDRVIADTARSMATAVSKNELLIVEAQ